MPPLRLQASPHSRGWAFDLRGGQKLAHIQGEPTGAALALMHPTTAPSASWDNAAMESFFSSLKTERTGRKTYRTRDEARADVFDYIERFYNAKRRHSTIGYLSPMEFESRAGLA
jgi:putative transposase